MKKLRTFAVSMIIAAIGLLIYCAGFYIKSYEQNLAARQEYAELSQMAGVKNREGAGLLADGKKTDEDSSTKNSEKKRRKKQRRSSESKNKNCTDEIRESFGISWENLRKINSQTVAWITVPGADISYPVVQAADDEYYLKHNFRGEEDLFGCIFLEHDIKKNFTDSHSILYGHNIEGNMMFANLNRYEQPEFLKKCPEIEITTPKRKFLYNRLPNQLIRQEKSISLIKQSRFTEKRQIREKHRKECGRSCKRKTKQLLQNLSMNLM